MTFNLDAAARYVAGRESLHHFGSIGISEADPPRIVAQAVHDFQQAHMLDADGMPGPVTLRALFEAEGCGPAPVLPFKWPTTLAELEAICGHRMMLHPHPDNAARLRPGTALDKALQVFSFPVQGGKDRVTLHRVAGPAILAAYTWAAFVSGHLAADVQGTVCRRKNWDPEGNPSTHSIGFAIDCDPQSNGRGDRTPSLPARFFSAMRACGAINGRDFGMPDKPKQTDPMHFQWLKDAAINAIPIIAR